MDKDGYVTAEELIKVVEKVGGCMSQDEARGLIRKVKKTKYFLEKKLRFCFEGGLRQGRVH